MTFAQPLWFAALTLLPLLFLLKKKGYLGFSDNRLLGGQSRTLRLWTKLPLFLASLALALLVVALARPQVAGEPVHKTTPGRDIIMAVDISYSMTFPFKGKLELHETPPELAFKTPYLERRHEEKGLKFVAPKDGLQRIHPLQDALLRFIENRWLQKTGDRMGLILFDVRPRYGWPLTDDLTTVVLMAERPTPEATFERWTAPPSPRCSLARPPALPACWPRPACPPASAVALRMCSSAGEALPAEIAQRFKDHFGMRHHGRHWLDRDAAHLPVQPPERRALRHYWQTGARLRDGSARRRRQRGGRMARSATCTSRAPVPR
jgi:hypothetical protein